MSSKLYLASYRGRFMEQERQYRYRAESWKDVMREVVIDRGTLLGSSEFEEMSGVERADKLSKIDDALSLCYDNIQRLAKNRDIAIPVKRGFKHRCKRIREKVSSMTDDELGKAGDE